MTCLEQVGDPEEHADMFQEVPALYHKPICICMPAAISHARGQPCYFFESAIVNLSSSILYSSRTVFDFGIQSSAVDILSLLGN